MCIRDNTSDTGVVFRLMFISLTMRAVLWRKWPIWLNTLKLITNHQLSCMKSQWLILKQLNQTHYNKQTKKKDRKTKSHTHVQFRILIIDHITCYMLSIIKLQNLCLIINTSSGPKNISKINSITSNIEFSLLQKITSNLEFWRMKLQIFFKTSNLKLHNSKLQIWSFIFLFAFWNL